MTMAAPQPHIRRMRSSPSSTPTSHRNQQCQNKSRTPSLRVVNFSSSNCSPRPSTTFRKAYPHMTPSPPSSGLTICNSPLLAMLLSTFQLRRDELQLLRPGPDLPRVQQHLHRHGRRYLARPGRLPVQAMLRDLRWDRPYRGHEQRRRLELLWECVPGG